MWTSSVHNQQPSTINRKIVSRFELEEGDDSEIGDKIVDITDV